MGSGKHQVAWSFLLFLCLTFTFFHNAENSELPCDWPSGSGRLTPYIPGKVESVFVGSSQECRERCMNQAAFICAAVSYRNLSGRCDLLAENNQTAHVTQIKVWEYFIRPICAGIWLPWKAENGTRLTGTGLVTTTTNLQGCMESCLNTASSNTECRAINIHTTSDTDNCEQQSSRVGDDDVERSLSTEWQYFTCPIWYLESSLARTSAAIKNQSTIGNLPHLFTDIKVPVSGYLVAWQYYLNTFAIDSCKTNATIWRHLGPDAHQYKLISSTTLAPEDRSTDGAKFQFTQNRAVRVKKNDILGVVGIISGACQKSLVSIDPSNGNPRKTLTILYPKKQYLVGDQFQYNNATPRQATPALRAYISAYLSLSGSPTSHLNMSLSDGQVLLRLPPPLTTEDSVVVAGYRIICSIDASMTQTVPCYNSLVPVSAKVVLLSLPNITRTYHSAVQIARNFNGAEQLEDKLSGVSSAFCTGRNRTDNVNITNATLPSDDSISQVNITLIYSFEGDECAKKLKLNRTGSDADYRNLNGSTYNFFLELDQGQTYDLTIYLLLADGAEAILWTQEFTTSSASTTMTGLTSGKIAAAVLVPIIILVSLVILLMILQRRGILKRIEVSLASMKFSNLKEAPSPAAANHSVHTNHSAVGNTQDATQPAIVSTTAEATYENSTRIPVDQLFERVEKEKRSFPDNPFHDEFKTLSHYNLAHDEGRTPENGPKNRFKNITAFNYTRVKLTTSAAHTSNYVNASYIKDYEGRKRFIAAQGPTNATVVDMWRTVQTTRAPVIVMLTNLVENNKNKCSQYWPEKGSAKYGDFLVTLLETSTFSSYVVRKMKYVVGNETGRVTLCHYTEWYDHDVPSPAGFLSFRARVKQESASSTAPIIVHCSAGVGRTGTYIALEILIQEANYSESKSVDIFACVNKLRSQRMAMVQVVEQYAFLYDMVSEALSCGNTSVPCADFPTTFHQWQQKQDGRESVLSEQFTRLSQTSKKVGGDVYSAAAQPENVSKNRDSTALPSDRQRVLLRNSDVYINATRCNGYQQKNGFILAQIPLSSTTPEYWRMIVEQKSTFVIYLNDCSGENPYLPLEGKSVKAGDITVKGLQKTGGDMAETVVECRWGSETHHVTFLELKTIGARLPTSQQLVGLCQQSEKYATSGSDIITVQCRNGCRLSGLFLIAMNLYMRTRIEQEVDIVLEVKLARLSRIQIISTLEEFEALYKFVEYYLSEFNTYSNFAAIA